MRTKDVVLGIAAGALTVTVLLKPPSAVVPERFANLMGSVDSRVTGDKRADWSKPLPKQTAEAVGQLALAAEPSAFVEALPRVKELRSKVLMSEHEQLELIAKLTDPKLVMSAGLILSALNIREYSEAEERQRMEAVDFLMRGMRATSGQGSPSHVADEVVKALLAQNTSPEMPLELKKSRLGDKIELFRVLKKYAPQRAKQLLKETNDVRQLSVFKYALNQ